MKVLAFDTSTEATAVALVEGPQVLFEDRSGAGPARHGETLLPRISLGLSQAGLRLDQLQLIAVGLGPGSFTGLRVGLATAKGLCLATGLPVVGVGSLPTLAAAMQGPDTHARVVLADAHKGEVFAAAYEAPAGATPVELLAPAHLGPDQAAQRLGQLGRPLQVGGQGLRRYGEVFQGALSEALWAPTEFDIPCARTLARLAIARFSAQGPDDLALLEPLYLRGSDAKLPGKALTV